MTLKMFVMQPGCSEEIVRQRTIDFGHFAIDEKGIENLENLILFGSREDPGKSAAGVLYHCAKDLGEEIGGNP